MAGNRIGIRRHEVSDLNNRNENGSEDRPEPRRRALLLGGIVTVYSGAIGIGVITAIMGHQTLDYLEVPGFLLTACALMLPMAYMADFFESPAERLRIRQWKELRKVSRQLEWESVGLRLERAKADLDRVRRCDGVPRQD